MLTHLIDRRDGAVPLVPLTRATLTDWLATQDAVHKAWIDGADFKAEPGRTLAVPGPDGSPVRVLVGLEDTADHWSFAALPFALPPGAYCLADPEGTPFADRAALGWALGGYRFERYKSPSDAQRAPAALVWPESCDRASVERDALATFLVRDLINTPAADMGPAELARAAADLAAEFGATCRVVVGDDLLDAGYPAIHAVGRGSDRAPRLIDLRWGSEDAPRLTLVGKGVCFDSGGLDLKPSSGMLLMKKDMGGGAHAMGLARMVMTAGLPVRLRMLVPAVENMVSGSSFRPLDVLATRKGLTVEVGNTDAEGRLVLSDALADADEEDPALIVDFATLTGAARAALGPDLPAMFCNHEPTAASLAAAADRVGDPLWRLPLWQPYAKTLDSTVADLNNVGAMPMAGAITAALFLERFVRRETLWVHFDLYGWHPGGRPGRQKGGEAMALRAVFAVLAERFG